MRLISPQKTGTEDMCVGENAILQINIFSDGPFLASLIFKVHHIMRSK